MGGSDFGDSMVDGDYVDPGVYCTCKDMMTRMEGGIVVVVVVAAGDGSDGVGSVDVEGNCMDAGLDEAGQKQVQFQ